MNRKTKGRLNIQTAFFYFQINNKLITMVNLAADNAT